MKRKFLSVLFALVLVASFSLVTAVPSQIAAEGSEQVRLVATHEGIAEWSIAQQHIGEYSIHLVAPGKCDWSDWAGTYADALIQIPLEGTTLEGLTLNGMNTMSWWNYLVSGYPPALRIKLDYDGDGSSDYHLVGEFAYQEWVEDHGYVYIGDWDPYTHYKPGLEATNTFYYPTYDTWMQTFHTTDNVSATRPDDTVTTTVHSDTVFWTYVVGGVYGEDWSSAPFATGVGAASYFATLGDYKTDNVSNMAGTKTLPILGDAEVLMLEFAITNEIGLTADPAGHEVYFDDLTINGVPYDLELPVARPLTVDDDRAENPDAYFQTIQGAIDCAIAGDTILVAAGTYDAEIFPIDVDVANLTIESVSGAASTLIEGGTTAGLIKVTADNVTIGGTDKGFAIENDVGGSVTGYDTDYGILVGGGVSAVGVKIQDNTFEINGNGIVLGPDATSTSGNKAEILNNTFVVGWDAVRTTGMWGSFQNLVEYIDILRNTVTIHSTPPTGGGMGFVLESAQHVLFDSNTITGGDAALYLTANYAGTTAITATDFTITNNTFTDCPRGIQIWPGTNVIGGPSTIQDVTISRNTFSGAKGIRILQSGSDGYISNVVINYNDISGTTTYGVENLLTTSVDAEYNWWDDVAGPTHAKNPYDGPTAGDGVSNYVDYLPWMIHTSLVSGWNIYSTPISSGTSTDTISEALDLWTTDSTKVTAAYYFDSSASPQAWAVATSLTPLAPVYLDMSASATIDVLMSTSNTAPPAMTMYQGWNLVGPAQLYTMGSDEALISAFWGTGEANLVGYSQVVSPGIYQTATWTFIRGGAGRGMYPTEGYWVYMVNQGTLGGFTYTPITMLP